MTASTFVFVDAALDDYQSLAQGVISGASVIVLSPSLDGIEQITAALEEQKGIKSVHILSHGQSGNLALGAAHLTPETFDRYRSNLQQWSAALADDADLLLYGCSVAAGDRGAQLLQQIHQVTGANVAASANRTGSTALGGDWELEQQVGRVKSALALQPEAMAGYQSVMTICRPNLLYAVDRIGSDASILRTVDITNGSSTVAGTLSFGTFALARQQETGRLYYIGIGNDDRIAYWDPDTQTNVTLPNGTGLPGTTFVKLAQAQQVVGGQIYALDDSSTTLYVIDPVNGGAIPLPAITNAPGSIRPFRGGSGDMAFDPNRPNILYVTVTEERGITNDLFSLYEIDLANPQQPVATFVGDLRDGVTGQGLNFEGSGALAFAQDGQLYATSAPPDPNSPGGDIPSLYRLDLNAVGGVVNATRVGSLDLGGRNFNDFATLPSPTEQVEIAVTKTDGRDTVTPGSNITYTITVTNFDNECDLNDITIVDNVAPQITNVSWTAVITGNGSFPTPQDAAGTGNSINARVNLGAGAVVTYTVTGIVDPAAAPGQEIINRATAIVPPGIIDPNPPTNIGEDSTTIVPLDPLNRAPIAVDDRDSARQNRPVNVDVLENDSDPDGDRIRITDATNGTNGTVTIDRNGTPNNPNDDFAVYTPNPGFVGTDTFTYTISDGRGGTDTAQVTVTVRSGDDGGDGDDDDCVQGINRTGTDRNDVLRGDDDINTLRGLGGNDTLRGLGCPDDLFGGRNNDRLFGGNASDNLQGQQNNDILRGNAGDDTINGGLGRDRLFGNFGRDTLRGGRRDDVAFGGRGNDVIQGNRGRDRLLGDGNADRIFGQQNNDRVAGNAGNDRLEGGLGDDQLRGGIGNDVLVGGRGNDRMFCEDGDDEAFGGRNDDLINGGNGSDVLRGQQNRDILRGARGADQLFGGLGFDILNGGIGNDTLYGNRGRDTLRGRGNNDILIGGLGADRLVGGRGADQFFYTSPQERGDTIVDFEVGVDVVNLSQVFAASRYSSAQPFEDYVRVRQSGANTIVRLDTNGDQTGGFQILFTMIGISANTINSNSFVV